MTTTESKRSSMDSMSSVANIPNGMATMVYNVRMTTAEIGHTP